MTDAFTVSGVRVTHETADLSDLEAASHADWRDRIDDLLAGDAVEEAAVLQTCNRVEEYVVTGSADEGRDALADFAGVPRDAVVPMDHTGSLRHLLRVAAGLESQVLGEDQILGQVREAYTEAADRDALGDVLEPALLKAIHVGERARTETAINEGTVSLGSAAIDLADLEVGLDGRTVLVIGAGDTARTVATALPAATDEVRIANRSPDRADRLASLLERPVETTDLTDLATALRSADVAVSATGSEEPVLDADRLSGAGETLVIDLAQPRDVAPDATEVSHVSVRDLDDLRAITEATHEERREAATEVEAIVAEEFDLLLDQYKRARADAVIASMHRGGERIKEAELERALAKVGDDLTEEQREVVESLADSLVSQILAVPTESLREAAAEDDWETIATALDLFDPHLDEGAEEVFEAVEAATADGSEE